MNTSVSLNSNDSVWVTTWVDPTKFELAFDITVKTSDSTQVTATFSHNELIQLVIERGHSAGLARPKFENRDPETRARVPYRPTFAYPKRGYTQNWDGQGPNTTVLPSKEDAEKVLTAMVEVLDRYGFVTVNDLYDLTGLRTYYGGATRGWKNLAGASVKEAPDGSPGWFLDLPPMADLEGR